MTVDLKAQPVQTTRDAASRAYDEPAFAALNRGCGGDHMQRHEKNAEVLKIPTRLVHGVTMAGTNFHSCIANTSRLW